MASLIRLSPSTTVTTRRGTLRRCRIAVAATGSVGETIAPSTNAAAHEIPGTIAWATTATAPIVASTRPIDSSEIALKLLLSSRSDEKNAAE